MNGLLVDINLINPIHHEKSFIYLGSFGPGRPNREFMHFDHISKWRDYLLTLQINDTRVPGIHRDVYHDALRALFLAWVELAIVQCAEMQALRSLEGALRGAYFQRLDVKARARKHKFKPSLGQFINFMSKCDDMPDALHSKSEQGPGSALGSIRNRLAHGDLLNTLPCGGLFESVRELIVYAYRNNPESGLSPSQIGCIQSGD